MSPARAGHQSRGRPHPDHPPHHDLLAAARHRAATDPEWHAAYRRWRPPVERAVAWLVHRGDRKPRHRGTIANDTWLHTRAAALDLRRLINLGLTRTGSTWTSHRMHRGATRPTAGWPLNKIFMRLLPLLRLRLFTDRLWARPNGAGRSWNHSCWTRTDDELSEGRDQRTRLKVFLCQQKYRRSKLPIRNPWITKEPREMINCAT